MVSIWIRKGDEISARYASSEFLLMTVDMGTSFPPDCHRPGFKLGLSFATADMVGSFLDFATIFECFSLYFFLFRSVFSSLFSLVQNINSSDIRGSPCY